MGTYWKSFWRAAGIRALWTFAECMLSMLPVGVAIQEIGWVQVVSVSATAAVISILKSIVTKLPEVEGDV